MVLFVVLSWWSGRSAEMLHGQDDGRRCVFHHDKMYTFLYASCSGKGPGTQGIIKDGLQWATPRAISFG
jgi:hypothetical protein